MIEKIKDAAAILILIACGLIVIMLVYTFIAGLIESVGNWHAAEVVQALLIAVAVMILGAVFFLALAWAENRIKKKMRK